MTKTICLIRNKSEIIEQTKQRNPYLKRISSNVPHQYSYDIETGKHFLHSQNQPDIEINKTGSLKPKYKNYFTGFANHSQRYNQAAQDPAFMHYVPNLNYTKSNSFYTPMPDKFAGYAQFPYKMTQQFPQNLCKKGDFLRSLTMRKCQSQIQKQIKPKKSSSLILEHSSKTFLNPQQNDQYFNLSFMSMTESKPLPKKAKKTCYNYKCKYQKYFLFNQKQKIEQSTKYSVNSLSNTFGMSFHESGLRLQSQQSQMIFKKR